MAAKLIVLDWDHLGMHVSSLKHCDKDKDVIFMCETQENASYVKHHKKKLIFLFSAMRHFASELKAEGYQVDYVDYENSANTQALCSEITRAVKRHNAANVQITFPGEYRILKQLKDLKKGLAIPLEILEDDRFLCSAKDFQAWAKDRNTFLMASFYQMMRKEHKILVSDNLKPEGGKWSFDSENRKFPTGRLMVPEPFTQKKDSVVEDVTKLVEKHFQSHFGKSENFHFAVTRAQALKALDHFIEYRLAKFGDYQDAMIEGEPWMYHSHLSFYINAGLLHPLECIRRVEHAYHDGDIPLNAAEGFIRQILGWREYVRGIYWYKMPNYKKENFFDAKRPLPDFFWSGNVKMNCLSQCINETKQNAYAHHIQRLMVLGNYCLLTGVNPDEVNEWYLIVYADAFEWVELPNVSGMILFADGGLLATKPYASGGAYINKMSNYCKNCSYKVSVKNGPGACPFNYLYWDFLDRHKEKLSRNHRLKMIYNILAKMSGEKLKEIRQDAKDFLQHHHS